MPTPPPSATTDYRATPAREAAVTRLIADALGVDARVPEPLHQAAAVITALDAADEHIASGATLRAWTGIVEAAVAYSTAFDRRDELAMRRHLGYLRHLTRSLRRAATGGTDDQPA